MRTTSSLESLNSVLGRLIPHKPNIFKFFDGIRIHEFAKYQELLQLDTLETESGPTRKRKRDQERDDRIKQVTQDLVDEKITTRMFLETFSMAENSLPHSGNFFIYIKQTNRHFSPRIIKIGKIICESRKLNGKYVNIRKWKSCYLLFREKN